MPAHPPQEEDNLRVKEACVQRGVELVRSGTSVRRAASISGAPAETIRRRAAGQVSQLNRATNGQQRLTDDEERALVQYILKMEAAGFPMRRGDVEDSAMSLILARMRMQPDIDNTAPVPQPLGDRWFERLIARYGNQFSFRNKASLARDRSRGLTKDNAEHFFFLLKSLIKEQNLTEADIWSMDETGVQHGVASKQFKYAGSAKSRKETATSRKGQYMLGKASGSGAAA
ncbi:hypothetical protein CF326_g8092 [Tilletia indica]|nr:hypothetical protein CF326_g8092 [Tilletia indica]